MLVTESWGGGFPGNQKPPLDTPLDIGVGIELELLLHVPELELQKRN